MKVAFVSRKNCLEQRGGDTIQMFLTKEYLEKNFPIKIDICLSKDELSREYDLVHIFNIQNYDESFEYLKKAKELGIKTAISTIYWNLNYIRYINVHYKLFKSEKYLNNTFINGVVKTICFIINKFRISNWKRLLKTRKILIEADYLLPNSDEELQIISRDFFLRLNNLKKKSCSIPNAVKSNMVEKQDQYKIDCKNYVLTVGRIEPIKNQLLVVKALMDYPEIPIIFVGNIPQNRNEHYVNELYSYSKKRGNVHFVSEVPHDEINNYYKNARVHVLASFRESPGLVSLEALRYGCEIVVSDEKFCPIKYYKFDEFGHVCNPLNLESIKNAILEAYEVQKNHADVDYFKFYSYNTVAKKTYQCYRKILGDKD